MRIEAYTQVQQMYSTKKIVATENTKKGSFLDAVQISSLGKDIQTAKAAVANSPEVRTEITEPLKASIEAGTYDVSTESFAEKLFNRYSQSK